MAYMVCGKPWETASPILFTLTSRRDFDFECSNTSFNENRMDGVDMNSNGLDQCVRNNRGRILWFSEDCTKTTNTTLFPRYMDI